MANEKECFNLSKWLELVEPRYYGFTSVFVLLIREKDFKEKGSVCLDMSLDASGCLHRLNENIHRNIHFQVL